MRKAFFILFVVYICFIIECVVAEIIGSRWTPNFLILVIVFFNLFRGIRYSLFAAIIAGLLKDSLAVNAFGLNVFSFVACAYLTSLIKIYIYHTGSNVSRILLVFFISIINVCIQFIVNLMFLSIYISHVFVYVLVPEVLMTAFFTVYVFERLKRCALRLFA